MGSTKQNNIATKKAYKRAHMKTILHHPAFSGVWCVELTQGFIALVDSCDIGVIKKHSWSINNTGYARTCINRKNILMHRMIMNSAPGDEVDHINGNRTDNRRNNLRHVSRPQNSWNYHKRQIGPSGFRGVCYQANCKKWKAQIRHNIKNYHIGLFDTPKEAAIAYDKEARRLRGAFARLNFPDETENS